MMQPYPTSDYSVDNHTGIRYRKSMNSTTKRHEKAIRESIERRFSQGWTPEQIAKRIWLCFGYLPDWTADTVIVKMHAGNTTFRKEVAA